MESNQLDQLNEHITKAKEELNQACKILCQNYSTKLDHVSAVVGNTTDIVCNCEYEVDKFVRETKKFLEEEKLGI